MKKFLYTLILWLMLATPLFGAELSKVATFSWEQPGVSQYLLGWTLYQAAVSGGPYTKVVDIPYTGTPSATYTANTTLLIPGNPGDKVTRYFVLSARSQGNPETAYSNEVSNVFDIPYPTIPAPFNLRIVITVEPVP